MNPRVFTGESAHREISSKLEGYPLARRLAREVYDFYGSCLTYAESRDFPSAFFTIQLEHDPVALASAEIRLRPGTARMPEALAHELLHLRLPVIGFPLGEIVRVPLFLDPYARNFLGMCHWVLNLLQHEINFQAFLAMGFDRSHFLAMAGEAKDYRRILEERRERRAIPELDFPWWCMEYLGHFFTARHGRGDGSMDHARDVLEWGARLYPELKTITAEIIRRVELGALKDPGRYARQVNSLLGLMRIPMFLSWIRLGFSRSARPAALRLDATGAYRIEMGNVFSVLALD